IGMLSSWSSFSFSLIGLLRACFENAVGARAVSARSSRTSTFVRAATGDRSCSGRKTPFSRHALKGNINVLLKQRTPLLAFELVAALLRAFIQPSRPALPVEELSVSRWNKLRAQAHEAAQGVAPDGLSHGQLSAAFGPIVLLERGPVVMPN